MTDRDGIDGFSGTVSGAGSYLFRGPNGNVTVNLSGPLSETVDGAGEWTNENFAKQDIDLFELTGSLFGLGASLSFAHPTQGGLSITVGGSAVVGAELGEIICETSEQVLQHDLIGNFIKNSEVSARGRSAIQCL